MGSCRFAGSLTYCKRLQRREPLEIRRGELLRVTAATLRRQTFVYNGRIPKSGINATNSFEHPPGRALVPYCDRSHIDAVGVTGRKVQGHTPGWRVGRDDDIDLHHARHEARRGAGV